ncbi:hypothetical protein EV426DRAFT_296094 [Tirmania nivea]|nr:hypothetical protein EV426DRAFT_296094 [Tirmania nivea]
MSNRIQTPIVRFAKLVKNDWQPTLANSLPIPRAHSESKEEAFGRIGNILGAIALPAHPRLADCEAQAVLSHLEDGDRPEASWVNFLDVLGIQPCHTELYELQPEPELFKGIVPMRWRGRDFAALCSMLGFQAASTASTKTTMELPTQWSGPLGWMQFRASSEGCVVEFRLRMGEGCPTYLPYDTREFFKNARAAPMHFVRRAWQSIGGYVYDSLDSSTSAGIGVNCAPRILFFSGIRDKKKVKPPPRTVDELLRQVMAKKGASDDDLRNIVLGSQQEQWNDDPANEGSDSEGSRLLDGLSQLLPSDVGRGPRHNPGQRKTKDSRKLELLTEDPGLLHTVADGTWADTRGLHWRNRVDEYCRFLISDAELAIRGNCFRAGNLCIDKTKLLPRVKSALRFLRPDGFYFSPTHLMAADLKDIFEHVMSQLSTCKKSDIFSPNAMNPLQAIRQGQPMTTVSAANKQKHPVQPHEIVLHAATLVNAVHFATQNSRNHLRHEEIKLLSNASWMLTQILQHTGPCAADFEWSVMMCAPLFEHLLKWFGSEDFKLDTEFLDRPCVAIELVDGEENTSKIRFENKGYVNKMWPSERLTGTYMLPLVGNGDLDGKTVIYGFLNVLFIYFWVIPLRWSSDVQRYDSTIPLSVTMV